MTDTATTFRPIDVTGYAPCALRDQPAPVLDWVDLDRCLVATRITAILRTALERKAA